MSIRAPVMIGLVVAALLAVGLVVVMGLPRSGDWASRSTGSEEPGGSGQSTSVSEEIIREEIPDGAAVATFAGGCFWCTEASFQETAGVSNAISGYGGGPEYNPTYKEVYTGSTGHRESLRIYFDPDEVSYEELLDVYWRTIDPTDNGGQFVDRGMPYTTAIFYHDDGQREAAETSKRALAESGKLDSPIVTEILPLTTFYEAEEYHQDFYQHSSERYKQYADASGRKEFKELVWGEIKKQK